MWEVSPIFLGQERAGIFFGPKYIEIDHTAILQKSLDRSLLLCIPIREVRSSGVRASIAIVHIRKFYKM